MNNTESRLSRVVHLRPTSWGVQPEPRIDEDLERRIDAAYHDLMTAPDDAGKLLAFTHMKELIAQRSAARVRQMERERGLA